MSWINNLINIAKNKNPGKCPVCGSTNTDYGYTAVERSEMCWGTVWCNDCKHAYHISRAKIEKDTKFCNIPKDLVY